jgi:phosphatidylserine/phosphatidylglycerophosphate/cardiolipin synthase-like enzyme
MKRIAPAMFLLLAALTARPALAATPEIAVYFSPHGGCTEAVVKQLDAARSSVQVQAYSFTSKDIAKALVDAHKRGVRVEVILDRSVEKEGYTEADFLLHAGVPVKVDALHAIAHNKIMVIDGATVITGSFNFTNQAEKSNAENLLVIHDRELAAKYADNWRLHAGHSKEYQGKGQESEKPRGRSQKSGASERAQAPVTPAAGGYVASKRSQVFHRADCKGAASISPQNVVHYATRDEAVAAGKQPAHDCNP